MNKKPFDNLFNRFPGWRITLIAIAISLLLFTLSTKGQATEPFKGAKKIVMVCEDSGHDLYKRVGSYLGSQGYSIENANADFLTFNTGLRGTSRFNFSYMINVVILDNSVTLTMKWKVNNGILANTRETGLYDWSYSPGNGNARGIVYNDVNAAFKSFGYTLVEFY